MEGLENLHEDNRDVHRLAKISLCGFVCCRKCKVEHKFWYCIRGSRIVEPPPPYSAVW